MTERTPIETTDDLVQVANWIDWATGLDPLHVRVTPLIPSADGGTMPGPVVLDLVIPTPHGISVISAPEKHGDDALSERCISLPSDDVHLTIGEAAFEYACRYDVSHVVIYMRGGMALSFGTSHEDARPESESCSDGQRGLPHEEVGTNEPHRYKKETNMDATTARAIIEVATSDKGFDHTHWWLHNLLEGARSEIEAAKIIWSAVRPGSGAIMFSADATLKIRSIAETQL